MLWQHEVAGIHTEVRCYQSYSAILCRGLFAKDIEVGEYHHVLTKSYGVLNWLAFKVP